ncbi:MAG: hypothetical protein LBJ31_04380 [Treponema sp.]|nr:hypothetical protein [Treponema sp.]
MASKVVKIFRNIAIGLGVLLVLISILANIGKNDKPQAAASQSEQAISIELIDPAWIDHRDISLNTINYEIVKVDTAHLGNTKRFTYKIVIYQRLNKAEIEQVAIDVFDLAQIETPFNALAIGFYDYPEFIEMGDGYRLGYVEYAPNGKWKDALEVKTGDYSTMQMTSHVEEPDWSKAITHTDAVMYKDWFEVLRTFPDDENSMEYEAETDKIIGEKYGLTPEQVEAAILKTMITFR